MEFFIVHLLFLYCVRVYSSLSSSTFAKTKSVNVEKANVTADNCENFTLLMFLISFTFFASVCIALFFCDFWKKKEGCCS